VKKLFFSLLPKFFLGFPCFVDLMSLDEASDKAKRRKPKKHGSQSN